MLQETLVLGTIVLSGIAVTTPLASLITVNQCTIAAVQRFGEFLRAAGPGLHFRVPFADRVIGSINLRAQQLDTVGGLVTDIDPDPKVTESMNALNAAQRMRAAAAEKGEAERILKITAAEGDAQSRAIQGRGIAEQRRIVIASLRDSVDEFRRTVPGTTVKDVMNLVLMTQYFDMLKEALHQNLWA